MQFCPFGTILVFTLYIITKYQLCYCKCGLGCAKKDMNKVSVLASEKSCKNGHEYKGKLLKSTDCSMVCPSSPLFVYGKKTTSKCTSLGCDCYCVDRKFVVDGKCTGEYVNSAFTIYKGM